MSGRSRHVIGFVVLLLALAMPRAAAAPHETPRTVSDTLRGAPVAAPSTVGAQAIDGLAVEATTTYRLDVSAGVVHVRSQVTLTNTRPPENLGYGTRTYYFDQFAVAALGPITSPRASRDGDGTSMSVRVETPGAHVDHLVVDLSPNLTYGAPQHLVIEYDLPSQPNGSEAPTRVNEAFATWYVNSVGDDGAGTVVIDVPERFDLETVTDANGRTEESDGRSITHFEGLTFEQGFFGVSARDDDALVIRSTTVDDDEFEIQAWPGDDQWAAFAVDTVEEGIPALTEWIGLDVDGERDITVSESGTPYLYGYGGWYSPLDDRVEIGDQLDLHTMLHELSHIWYHRELFSSRWVTEGLADLAANRAARELDEKPLPIEPLDRSRPGGQPLNQWNEVDPGDVSDVAERYGYDTSYALMSAIVEEVGADTIRGVVERATAKELPLGHDDDVLLRRFTDWRYFYDLLVTSPDVDVAALDALFDTYVWTADDRAKVDTRRGAMDAYRTFESAGGEWLTPIVVRKALADWDFDKAERARTVAQTVLEARDTLEEVLAGTGIEATPVQDAYEQATSVSDLETLVDDLPGITDAARELAALNAELDGLDPIRRLGLVGRDVDDTQDEAEAAFADGELDDMADLVADANTAVDQALPSAAALVVVPAAWLMVLVGAIGVRRKRRRLADELAAD